MNVLASLFGNYSKRELKRIQPICDRVLMKEDTYKDMTDEELTAQTGVLKDRLADGETWMISCPTRSPYAARPRPVCWGCVTSRCRSSAASCSTRAGSPK